jgi:L-galactose dehydrogenase
MRHNTLGRTGLQVSAIGFGAATLGDEYGRLDPTEGARAVHAAIDHGINLFDVSPYYGRTLAESRLGEYLKGKRQRVVLATKVGRYDRFLPEGFDFTAARVISSVEESLTRLRTDVIDIFLAHDIEFAPLERILHDTLPAMRLLREQGKVRFVGVTGFPLEMLRAVVEQADVDVVLSYCHHNLLNTRLDAVLAPATLERSIGLINGSPLHMGVLTRHGPPPWHPAPPEVRAAGERAAAWCDERGLDLAELALRAAVPHPAVHSTLVGIRTGAEVATSLRALLPDPDPHLTAELRSMLAPVKDREWPSGLPENNPTGAW